MSKSSISALRPCYGAADGTPPAVEAFGAFDFSYPRGETRGDILLGMPFIEAAGEAGKACGTERGRFNAGRAQHIRTEEV